MRNANDIILLADQNWNIVEANKRAVECYGYSPEEWQRVHMADLRASDSRTAFQRHTEQLLARGSAIYETVHRRKDRSTFPVEVSGRMIEVGGIHYRLVIIRDITERKRAEEAQARLVAAVEQAAESIMVTDTAGTIQYVNPAFERITGYTREEAVGKNPRILKSGVHDDAFYRKLWESLVRGETWSGRFMNKRKDGSLYEEEATLSPVRDAAGQIVNYVAVKRDVTREAQLETQLRQAQKMEAIGRLAGGVAHDFNNILMSILGNSDLALRRLAPGDRLHAYLEEIRLAGHRAADLTRQLLAFSRKQLFQPSVLDLNATLTNLQKMLRRLISEDIHLTLALAPDLGRTKADPGQIEQVIVNLAVNARDAMPRGGTLTLETANVELTEALLSHGEEIPPGRYVMLGVRDTGVGMTPEVKAHLFEPFFTTKPKGKGTGLGLSTVYGIVKQSGGYIEVESEPDQGAFFRVCLPRVDEAAEATGPGAAIGELRRGNETVLIAEDDDTVRHMTSAVLKECGYVVLTASRGAEALELARRHPGDIHLLLTDVVMPGMTGRDLSAALLNSRPGMKTIYMSGYTDTVLIGHDLDKPGVSFLQKPFTPETLTARVRAALDAGTAGPGA
jgi:PAS domain S-box-containing protein